MPHEEPKIDMIELARNFTLEELKQDPSPNNLALMLLQVRCLMDDCRKGLGSGFPQWEDDHIYSILEKFEYVLGLIISDIEHYDQR